jgi:hypothetical protein
VFDEMFEWDFHWLLLISYGVDLKAMDNYVVDPNKMFSTKVCFNGGKPNLFMVRDDFTLKDLKNQPDEINQRLNHGDTRRVEDIWYECPSFNSVERRRHEEHVLDIWSAQHVSDDRDGCFVVQIIWRYSKSLIRPDEDV